MATSDQAGITRLRTRSPHPSTPAPRKSHGRMAGPAQGQRFHDYGSPAKAAAVSRSGKDNDEDLATRTVTHTGNHGPQLYSEQNLERLDSAVGQWVRASAITPPLNSTASSAGGNGGHYDISNRTDELWDFDSNSFSDEAPVRREARTLAARSNANHLLPKLPPELSCHPTIAEMTHMSAAELAGVKDFTIIRQNYGSIWCAVHCGNEHFAKGH